MQGMSRLVTLSFLKILFHIHTHILMSSLLFKIGMPIDSESSRSLSCHFVSDCVGVIRKEVLAKLILVLGCCFLG